MQNLAQYAEQPSVKLPATQMDCRQMPGGSAVAPQPPPLPPRFTNGPPTSAPPPPLPPRPPPPQTSVDKPPSVQKTEIPVIKSDEDNQTPLLTEKQEAIDPPKKLTLPQTLTPKQNKPTTLLVEPMRQLPDQAQKHYLFRDLIGETNFFPFYYSPFQEAFLIPSGNKWCFGKMPFLTWLLRNGISLEWIKNHLK